MSETIVQAKVESITPLTDSIIQLILNPDHFINYEAGHYLQILLEELTLSYSIANAPLGSRKYELHIRHSADNSYNQRLLSVIKEQSQVTLSLPYGECSLSHLRADRPIMFIAVGTGFAPVKAMIEQLLAWGDSRLFELYWGARSRSDLYMNDTVQSWQTHVRHFNHAALLVRTDKESLLSHVLKKHPHDLHDWQFVLSGPFDMVYTARDLLVEQGVSPNQLFSDAFSFEVK